MTPTETYQHALEGIARLQVKLTDLPLGNSTLKNAVHGPIRNSGPGLGHPCMSVLAHSHFVNYGGERRDRRPTTAVDNTMLYYCKPYHQTYITLHFTTLYFTVLHCTEPYHFHTALKLAVCIRIISSCRYPWYAGCSDVILIYYHLPLTLSRFTGGYYSYIYAKLQSAQIWKNIFEKDPLSRWAEESEKVSSSHYKTVTVRRETLSSGDSDKIVRRLLRIITKMKECYVMDFLLI
jgi:Peptidase family M3